MPAVDAQIEQSFLYLSIQSSYESSHNQLSFDTTNVETQGEVTCSHFSEMLTLLNDLPFETLFSHHHQTGAAWFSFRTY